MSKHFKNLVFRSLILITMLGFIPTHSFANTGDGGNCIEGSQADCLGNCNGSASLDSQGNCCLESARGCDDLCDSGAEIDQCNICGGDGKSCLDCAGEPFGDASFDICNVCEGDGTSCLDCLGQPFGSAEIDGCGVCGGDGSTCNTCPRAGIRIDRRQPQDNFTITNDAPGCLQPLFDQFYKDCPHKGHPGSCIAIRLINEICGINSTVASNNPCYRDYVYNPNTIHFTVANDCSDIQNSNATEVNECLASVVKIVSPISVLLDGSQNISSERLVLTQFPLEPGKVGQWYSWKASAEAPLLVYDPDHTGTVASAHQLFGNWTFGGKRVAHLSSTMSDAINQDVRWDNGFDALATLDVNGDERISGKELESLALWFDKNEDGISQQGEVSSVEENGITALFYVNREEDSNSNDIYVKYGFERVVDGSLSSGTLVDWYANHAQSKQAVLLKEMLSLRNLAGTTTEGTRDLFVQKSEREVTDIPDELMALQEMNAFDSIWHWKEVDGDMQGILVFSSMDRKEDVTGMSIIQLKRKTDVGSQNLGMAIPFTAKKSVNANRQGELQFTVPSGNSAETRTKAVFSKDVSSLSGTSSIFRGNGDSGKNWYTYKWTAEKIF